MFYKDIRRNPEEFAETLVQGSNTISTLEILHTGSKLSLWDIGNVIETYMEESDQTITIEYVNWVNIFC